LDGRASGVSTFTAAAAAAAAVAAVWTGVAAAHVPAPLPTTLDHERCAAAGVALAATGVCALLAAVGATVFTARGIFAAAVAVGAGAAFTSRRLRPRFRTGAAAPAVTICENESCERGFGSAGATLSVW
jgi:hypothetical protein